MELFLKHFQPYLANLKQLVEVNGQSFDLRGVSKGAPYWALFLPLELMTCRFVSLHQCVYVDDATLISIHNNSLDKEEVRLSDLVTARKWFSENGLVLNEEKTQSMNFDLRHVSNDSDPVNFLGFTWTLP